MSTIAQVGTLERAAAQAATVRLSATIDGQERSYRARIVKVLGEDGEEGMWIHLPDDLAGANALVAALPECRGTFSIDQARFIFQASVVKRDRHLWVTDRTMFDALLLSPARDLQRIEDRRWERLPVGEQSGVRGQLFWGVLEPPGPATKKKPPLVAIPGTLRDLSAMGAGFICPTMRQLLIAKPEEPMTCTIHFRGESISLAASLAQVSVISTRTLRVGMSFDAQDPQTGQNLACMEKVIAELQRQHSLRRAHRLR